MYPECVGLRNILEAFIKHSLTFLVLEKISSTFGEIALTAGKVSHPGSVISRTI